MLSAEQYGISKHIQEEKKQYDTVELNCDPKLREVKAMIYGTNLQLSTTPREEHKKANSMMFRNESAKAIA